MRRVALLLLLLLLFSVSVVAAQDTSTPASSGEEEWVDQFLVSEVFPAEGAASIASDAVITVIFNRPVVPMLSIQEMAGLPQPLTFSPEMPGSGEWINTSIYMFRPAEAWAVGTTYTVTVDPALKAMDGLVLAEPFTWEFSTVQAAVVSINPLDAAIDIRLDRMVQMTFNAPVDRESLETHFFLRDENGDSVPGTFTWNDDETGFSFKPDDLLTIDTVYSFGFPDAVVYEAAKRATFPGVSWTFVTVLYPSVVATDPSDGTKNVNRSGMTIYFSAPMSIDLDTAKDLVLIDPEPWREPEFYYRDWSDSLSVSFPTEPSTDYTVTILPGFTDPYGNTTEESLTIRYTTDAYPPDVSMHVSYPLGFYNAYREPTQLFVTHRNVSRLDLELYTFELEEFVEVAANSGLWDYQPSSRVSVRNWQIESIAPENVDRYELLSMGKGGDWDCPQALPPRVAVGDSAIVISSPDPIRARSEPVSGEIVELLYRDYVIPVVGGPVCANDLRWWEVELRSGDKAWVAESVGEEYFIDVHASAQQTEIEVVEDWEQDGLAPGLYFLQVQSPETAAMGRYPLRHIMMVATANLTVKASFDSVLVWATNVETGQPIPDAPIVLYNEKVEIIGRGRTDADGIVTIAIPTLSDLYRPVMAVLKTGEHFGLGQSGWTEGIDPWWFNANGMFYPQRYQAYLYTDRPIYRPDQPVHFRGVVRSKDDVTYTPPDRETVPVQIFNNSGEVVYEKELPLTRFGTFSDSFTLDADASLGGYRIEVNLTPAGADESEYYYRPYEGASVYFDVAEYRLPEFQVKVTPEVSEVVQGDTVRVVVDSKYFFGGPVSNASLNYNVLASPYGFYYVSPDKKWYDFTDYTIDAGPGEYYDPYLGVIASGDAVTDALGLFTIEIPADLGSATQSQTFTVEASVWDESNNTVSGRAEVIVHQGEVYIGARPTKYVSTAGQETTVEFISVDWEGTIVPDQDIAVEIVERRWSSVQEEDPFGRVTWTWEVEEIPVETGKVTTDENGQAVYPFTPPSGGTFKVIITSQDSRGNTVRASTYMWVSSREYVSWRQQNSNRIDLVVDADQYEVGDTAQILIASPFQGTVEALVTVERGRVLHSERITLDTNSYVYQLPITDDFAPNVFVSVMLVKGVDETNPVAAFRMGLAQIQVDNSRKELHIAIAPNTDLAGPGDTVTYTVTVTDWQGDPVVAEVGVGLTDLAALSLASPNSGPLLGHFYGIQGLSVRTGTALTMNTDQITQTLLDTVKGGGGGYGEGGLFDIREEFIDTAYWNPILVTGADGMATFDVTLPDNLTTWRLDARAVTSGEDGLTLVGQDTFDLLSTKPVLIRPVTPRFFIVNDTLSLGAVVNNNTRQDLEVAITLEAYGVTFNDATDEGISNTFTHNVSVPAQGRTRVDWPVTVQLVDDVELIFYVVDESGEYTDASRPVAGQGEKRLLPVYRYEVPEVVGTGGTMREAGTRTEGIQLWDVSDYEITEGELTITAQPSLAAATLDGLDYLRYYPYYCIEQTVSRFLPNVMTYRALELTGHADPKLKEELDTAVQLSLQRLYAEQKVDGGWGWFARDYSSPIVTAYALIGLAEARDAGYPVDENVIRKARTFLQGEFTSPTMSTPTWRLNRQVFILYALARAGVPDVARSARIFEYRSRLDLYAKALLATTLEMGGDTSGRIDTLISDLLNAAVISANGAYWEESYRDWWNWNTNTRTTAMVLQTLVRFRPESDLIPNVVRWLMVARTADHWETTQETAWAVMALTDWMVASDELLGSYDFSVSFNGEERLAESVVPDNITKTYQLVVDVAEMLQDDLNMVVFSRSEGEGNLYYTAYLRQFLPVPEVEPANRGIIIDRRYVMLGDPNREPITEARVGDLVQARLTIIVPNSLHYVVVEDPIPAGTEGVDPGLRTSQQIGTRPGLDTSDPLSRGWGWWWFSHIEFRDEKVVLYATYLPAGTYEYVYTIRAGLEGTYNVIPPTGTEFYFPDVYGRGAGSLFTVLPAEESE